VATTKSQYPWVPGQVQGGAHTFGQNIVVAGYSQFQGGQYSFLPGITAPGTVASGGTVLNSTGVDCMVYLAATSGSITAVKLLSYNGGVATAYTVQGTIASPNTLPVLVTGPGAIAVTYNASLAWTWVPK
jgi:hypothetical protein